MMQASRASLQVAFGVSIPGRPYLRVGWWQDGAERGRIDDDGKIHLADGETAESFLTAIAEAFGTRSPVPLGIGGSVVISRNQAGGVPANTIVNR